MDALKGFAVLSGPLWLILIILPISIWIAVKVSKDYKRRGLAGIGIFLLVFFLPFGDEIAGRIYLTGLCATQAGYTITGTVELLEEYRSEEGGKRIYNKYKNFDYNFLNKQFGRKYDSDKNYSHVFSIERRVKIILDSETQREVGRYIDFLYRGGWVMRNLTPHHNAISCRISSAPDFERKFYGKILQLHDPEISDRSN